MTAAHVSPSIENDHRPVRQNRRSMCPRFGGDTCIEGVPDPGFVRSALPLVRRVPNASGTHGDASRPNVSPRVCPVRDTPAGTGTLAGRSGNPSGRCQVNRAERRRARVRIRRREPGQDMAAAVTCPDCNSVAAVAEVAPGHFRGVVKHDDTCPWYAALRRDLEADERD